MLAYLQRLDCSLALKGYLISEDAAVYLAALKEYVIAETCELGGHVVIDKGCGAVSCRHVMLSVEIDEELSELFKMCIIRDGGVVPYVQKLLLDSVQHGDPSEFVKPLKAKSVGRSLIDPRTGRQSYFDDSDSNTSILRPVPYLI